MGMKLHIMYLKAIDKHSQVAFLLLHFFPSFLDLGASAAWLYNSNMFSLAYELVNLLCFKYECLR